MENCLAPGRIVIVDNFRKEIRPAHISAFNVAHTIQDSPFASLTYESIRINLIRPYNLADLNLVNDTRGSTNRRAAVRKIIGEGRGAWDAGQTNSHKDKDGRHTKRHPRKSNNGRSHGPSLWYPSHVYYR